jgi:NADH-ubiquinone oxidoreductase chain 1
MPNLWWLMEYINFDYYIDHINNKDSYSYFSSNPLIEGLMYGSALGIKSCIMVFIFIWARASFPRIRFDQLMSFCWTVLLPLVIAFVILVPCILYSFEIIPSNVNLL